MSQIRDWLTNSPQGTAIAVASREGAQSLLEFLRKEGLIRRTDAKIGRWSEDARAFNTVFLCPTGECGVRYERVILWDAPHQAFADLPRGEVYIPEEYAAGAWMRELPTVDPLRQMFVIARTLTKSGAILRTTAADIDNELSRAAGGGWTEAMASLASLRSMQLIGPEKERLYMLPTRKIDPMNDPVYQRIQAIYDHATGKG